MVAVITGNGLGLGNTSLTQLGQSQGGSPSLGQAGNRSYVNTATGNLVLQSADEGLLFDGLPLNVLRTYNSLGQVNGNDGWTYGFSRNVSGLTGTLNTAGSTITRIDDDGASVVYAYNATLGVYVSTAQSGAVDTLSWNATSSTWTWTDAAASTQETYNATGQLTALTDTSSGASYSFSYTNGQLAQITAADGDTLLFGYNTNNQLISLSIQEIPPGQSTAVTRQAVTYGYDSQGRLSTVTTTLGSDTDSTTASYTTTYAYQGTTDLIGSVTQSDGTTVSYTYTQDAQGAYQVTGITTGTGTAAQTLTLSYGANSTTVTNALGNITTYQYNALGQLTEVIAPAVNGVSPATTYTYDANGNLLTSTDPNGAVTTYQYDANGNLLSVEDGAGNTVSYTYNASDQVTSQTTDTVPAQGEVGQSDYVAPSGAETTYYVYTATNQLAYTVDPLGNVTEHDYFTVNGLSELTSTRQYLGASYDLTNASPSTPPTLAQLQAWVQSSAVQSTLSQSTLTAYTYDVRGQLSRQTQYDTVNSSGVGVSDRSTLTTITTYDAHGRLLQTVISSVGRPIVTTSYAYDGLGRMMSKTFPVNLGGVTSYVYTDNGSSDTLAIIQGNGLTTTQVSNSAGQLVSSTQSASGQHSRATSTLYNADGQPIAAIDPAGNVSYTFYNADGEVTGMVDGDGNVTVYTYDADGHVLTTTQYATSVNTATWFSDGELTSSYPAGLPIPASTPNDRTTNTIYSAAGEAVATIDPAGNVTTTTYDGAGDVLSTTQYATPLTPVQRAALGSAPTLAALQADLTSDANNRTTLTIYDADGQAVATIDALGYVTVTSYNAAGDAVLSTAYATGLTSSQLSALGDSATLAAVQADLTTSAQDQTTRTYYDGVGRVVAQIDADGYLSTTGYIAVGGGRPAIENSVTTHYATALSNSQLCALTGTEAVATLIGLLGTNTTSEQSSIGIDAYGRTVSASTVDGTLTTYTYNAAGQVLSSTVSASGVARTTSATYDAFGDELTSTDATGATTTYVYNGLGQQVEATDPDGNSIWSYYDADGKLLYTIQGQPSEGTLNALGSVTAYTYNAFGEVTSTTTYAASLTLNTSGSNSGTSLNPAGATASQVATAIIALSAVIGDANATTTTTYTLDGQVATVTDGDGYQTATTYDAFGKVLSVQQQLSQPGNALSSSNSTLTTYAYNNRGEQLSETQGAGTSVASTTSNTYDAFGRVTSRTDGNGNTITYTYDNLGRQVSTSQTVQDSVRTTQTTYDAFGNVLSETDVLGNVTTYSYNIATHTTTMTTPVGITTTTVKDAYGDTVSVTDSGGNATTYTYDADGRLLTITDALGDITTNQYDGDGNLVLTTDANGDKVSYTYDAGGRVLTKTVDPNGLDRVTSYAYDGEGRELSVTNPLGSVTTYSYDGDGNVLSMVQDAGVGNFVNQTTTYTYDGEGKVLTETKGTGSSEASTTQYIYDSLGRLTDSIVDPSGLDLDTYYGYDANNNLIEVDDPIGNSSITIYNEANEVVYQFNAAGSSLSDLATVTQYWYDADGNRVSARAYSNLVSLDSYFKLNINTTAQALSTGASLAASAATSSDLVSYDVYNADGQQIFHIDPMGNVTETRYNALGQVAETLAYATPVTLSGALASALQAGTAQASDIQSALQQAGDSDATARTSYSYYDADGRLVYTVTPNWVDGVLGAVVSQTQYDAVGQVTADIVYGVPLPMSDVGAGSTTASIAQAVAQLNTAATTRGTQYFYDAAGEKVAETDPNGNTSYTFYDANGQIAATVDASGAVVQYTRDALGRVTNQTAFSTKVTTSGWLVNGEVSVTLAGALPSANSDSDRVTTTSYDALGRIAAVTHFQMGSQANGDTLSYVYDNDSRVIQTTDVDLSGNSTSRVTQYFYDAYGNNIATLNADGYLTTYVYDAAGQLTQTTVYATQVTAQAGETLAQLLPSTSPQDQTTTNYYDAHGNLVGTLDADGYFTQYTYDLDDDRLTTTRYATVSSFGGSASFGAIVQELAGTSSHQTVSTYDSYGDIVASQDYEGTVTTSTYDNLGDVIQVSVAAGTTDARTTTSEYDAFGNVVSTTDGLGNVTTYTYDLAGNKTSMTDADGNTTWYVYDTENRLVYTIRGVDDGTGVKNSLGEILEQDYDSFGDVARTKSYSDRISIGAGFSPTQSSIAAAVNAISGKGVNGDDSISYTYDLEGNVIRKIDGNGDVFDYSYDGFNDRSSSDNVAQNGLLSVYTYDAMGHMTSEVDGTGWVSPSSGAQILTTLRTQEWTYDAFGNMASYTDGDGATTSYGYDNLNHQLTQSLVVSGAVRETATSYDAYGRVLSSTDAMGLVTTYSYDDATRSMTVTSPGGISITTTYNREGQKIAITDAVGNTTSYQYDADGNLLKTVNPDGSSASNQYDAVGDLIETTDADGNVVEYVYDAGGRVLTKTVDPAGLKLVTTYTYDGRGLTLSKVDPTDVATDYRYDGNGNVTFTDQNAGGPDIQTSYVYNELNEVTSSSAEDYASSTGDYEVNDYGYDAFGHLTYEGLDTGKTQSTSYTYDADGHVISKTDGDHNKTYYFYDEAGEQIYAISPVGGGGPVPEVARAEIAQGSAVGGAVSRTWYNADGQVVGTTEYATVLTPSQLSTIARSGASIATVTSILTSSADDRSSYSVYNADGQLQYSIDATGAVTENVYNSDGQVSETLAYANPIVVSTTLAGTLQAGTATAANIQSALISVGDSSSNARITYTYYDDMGRVSFVISVASLNGQSGGLVKQTQYDSDGNIVAQIQYGDLIPLTQVGGSATTASISQYLAGDTNMHVTRSVYDAAGREVYSIDAGNNVTETQYDADGRVTWTLQYASAIAAPASWDVEDVAAAVQAANNGSTSTRGTENVYDAFGNIIKTYSKASSNPTAIYTYNGRGLKTSYTDANGNTWTYGYDDYGNLIKQTSPAVETASYSSAGEYQGVTSESIVTSYYRDGNGNLTEEIDASNTSQSRDTEYFYDTAGNLIRTAYEDPGAFDPTTGSIVSTGGGPNIYITYNAFGEAVVSQDANGNYAYNIYAADGRLAYAVDGNGYVTGYQYDAYGDQTAVTRYASPIDVSTLTTWSPGQPLSMTQMASALVTSSADRTITTTYDAQGNKLSVTEPETTYTNSNGTTATGSPVTQYTYDAYGNVTSQSVLVQGTPGQADAVWATTFNYYDALGHLTRTVDPMGFVTANTYDAFGDVTANTQYATAINTSGLVAGGTPPALPSAGSAATTGLDRVTLYTYDNNGNKASVSIQRSYVNAQGQSVVGFDTTTYGYDADNRLTAVTENGNTITTAYDALGRIASVTGPQVEVLVSNWQALLEANPSLTLSSPSLYILASQVVSYAYDGLGNKLMQTQSSTGSSQTVSTYYQYDGAGHLVAEMTPLDASGANWLSSQVKSMAYDSNGNLISESYTLTGNDNSTTTVTTVNTYDANNQQTSSVTWRSGILSPDKSSSTTYDAFGDVVLSGDGVANSTGSTYDNAGNKITSIDPKTGELHTYGYNLAGQMVSDTVPVAGGSGTAQTLYTLDLDGHTIAEQAPSTNSASGENSGILHATYDAWGNVLSSIDANGNTTTYIYNERNDVITETEASVTVASVDGSSATSTPVKTSSYDIDGNLVANTDENGNVIKDIYNALGQKMESVDGAGAVLYTAYDALGNSVAQQDGNGNITFSNVDALGRTVQSGEFELSAGGSSRQAVWQQAYVLDQNGDRIDSYDGIGSAYLQSGDSTDAALHANYDGYDSQKRVVWSQDAAQRAASTSEIHGVGNYGAGSWTQAPTNPNFSGGTTGWTMDAGYTTGSYTTVDGDTWSLAFTGTNNPNNGSGWAINTDRVPVAPGQTITANASFEVVGDHGGGAVQIIFYDASGNQLTGTDNTDVVSAGRGPGTSTLTATAPAGAAYAAIGIACTNYNLADATVYCSGVSWNYEPPAYITSLGLDNGSPVITLPSGSFTDQVNNSNFAEGNVGWDTNGWTIHTASNANSGWEASFGGNGTATMVNQDRVPVVPGQTISGLMRLGLYLAPQGAAASGQVAINWYDTNGNLIKTDTGTLVNDDHKGAWETSTISATAPAGAAYASLAVIGTANGIGSVSVESVQWNYQYVPQVPTGVVQDTYVYDMDGNLISQTTADGDTESWQYNQHGQVIQHTDLSGAQYTYTYDANTGAQIGESDNWSPAAQGQVAPSYVTAPLNTPNSETLTYYADGQIATETFSDGSSYSYQYDANGNLIREEDTTVDGNNNTVHTVTANQYDSHNRISSVIETNEVTGATMLQETFSYDAAGNRREVKATSNGSTQDAWYTYDGDNRVEIADGALQSGQIVVTDGTGSYENAYDANGNVVKIFTRNAVDDVMAQTQLYNAQNQLIESDYAVDVTQGATNNGVQKTTTYDADGHALITQTYYELGATIQSNNQTVTVSGELESATVNFYDVVGRMAESQTFNTPSGWDGTASPIPTGTPNPDANTYGTLQLQSEVLYQGPNGTSGYDADGDVVAYQYRDNTGRVDQYQVNYLKKDSYLQADTTGDSNTTNVQPATAQTIYDTRGNEVALEQHAEDPYGNIADTVHVFAYNGDGEIIEREDGTATSGTTLNLGSNPNQEVQHYTYVNGQQLAHFDNAGTLDVLDQVTAFSSNNDSPNSYVVQTGDTLESIAQAEYGNANLWYVIAQANDLSSDTNLALGQRLQIPAVTTHANSSTTFKPYDPTSIVGSTTPSLPTIAPPPPPVQAAGCSAAEILVIIVTVVVTIVTYGATSELLYGEAAALTAGEAATVGAIAGAAGSVAGQLTGMAEGIQSGFNWGAVAEGALGGAIAGGVTGGLQSSSAFTTGELDSAGNPILNGWGEALQGAAAYAGNDLAAKITDQPAHFSWAGLVASSVASVASGEVGTTLSQSQLGQTTGSYFDEVSARAVGDIVNREVSVALGDQHVPSWAQVGEDIAGYAIGEPIGEAIKTPVVQVIKAYQDQQAADAVNAINAKVVANADDNQTWNVKLWNQASTNVSAQLTNEGQAALDAAWQQTEANIGDGLYSEIQSAVSDARSGGGGEGSGSTFFVPSGTMPTATNGSSGVAYSSMPLNGHVGAQVDYFAATDDSLEGAVGSGNESAAGASDRLTIATGSNAAKDAVYSFVAQVVGNGGPSIDPTTASMSDWASYVHDYANLGTENPAAQLLPPVNVTANVQSSVVLGDQANPTPDQSVSDSLIAQDAPPSTAIDFSHIPPLSSQSWTNQQSNTQNTGSSIPPIPDYSSPITENFETTPLQIEAPTLSLVDVDSVQAAPAPPISASSIPANLFNFNLGVKSTPILPPVPSFAEFARQHQLETQPGFRPVEEGISQRIYEHISQGNRLERLMGGLQSGIGQTITGFLPGEDQYGNTHNVLTGQPILAADAKANHIASIGGMLVPGEEGFASLEKAVGNGIAGLFRREGANAAERIVPNGTSAGFVDLSKATELSPGTYRGNPQYIRFGQHVASPNFSTGGTISETVAELLAGKSPDLIGNSPIRVIYRDGVPFTLDNRRLIAFNAAGIDDIPFRVVNAGDPEIATLLRNPTRMNPIAGEGRYIVVAPKADQIAARQLLLENGLIR